MESLGIIFGVAIAAGIGAYFWRARRPHPPANRALQVLTIAIATAAGAAGAYYGMRFVFDGGPLAVDKTLEDLKQTPLVRLVIADVPEAETLIRTALEEDRRTPVTQGSTRAFAAMSELRVAYIVPALAAADDVSALAAVAARTAMLRHLQAASMTTCREFALVGLQRVDKLDPKGQELFQATLAALEQAYRSGRDAKNSAKPPLPTDGEASALLAEAGLQPQDFENIRRLVDLPDAEACALATRINSAPTQVAAPKAGPLARYLISKQ